MAEVCKVWLAAGSTRGTMTLSHIQYQLPRLYWSQRSCHWDCAAVGPLKRGFLSCLHMNNIEASEQVYFSDMKKKTVVCCWSLTAINGAVIVLTVFCTYLTSTLFRSKAAMALNSLPVSIANNSFCCPLCEFLWHMNYGLPTLSQFYLNGKDGTASLCMWLRVDSLFVEFTLYRIL